MFSFSCFRCAKNGTPACCSRRRALKEDLLSVPRAEEIFVPLRRGVPALVLGKFVVAAQVHRHRSAAVRAARKELRRYRHRWRPICRRRQHTVRYGEALRFDHRADGFLVVKRLLTARLTALKQAVVALRVEKMLLSKPAFRKQWSTFVVMTK